MTANSFEAYVAQAWPRLLRSAWLLTGDWHRAEDLVQTVLVRAHDRWPRLRDNAPDAYLRAMMATTYLSWWRRRWRAEIPFEHLPERSEADRHDEIELRHLMPVLPDAAGAGGRRDAHAPAGPLGDQPAGLATIGRFLAGIRAASRKHHRPCEVGLIGSR
jgi:hypothetical protein